MKTIILNKEDNDKAGIDNQTLAMFNDILKIKYYSNWIIEVVDKQKLTDDNLLKVVELGFVEIKRNQFKYVGFPHSLIITTNQWNIQKYYQWIKSYSIYNPYLVPYNNKIMEIFYIAMNESKTKIVLSEKRKYHFIANDDGFMIWSWRYL